MSTFIHFLILFQIHVLILQVVLFISECKPKYKYSWSLPNRWFHYQTTNFESILMKQIDKAWQDIPLLNRGGK